MSFINHNELANLTDKCVLNISWSLIFLTLVPTLSHSLQPWLIKREKNLCIYLKNWWNSLSKATSQITSTWNFKLIFQRFVLLSWNFEEIWNYVFCFFNFFLQADSNFHIGKSKADRNSGKECGGITHWGWFWGNLEPIPLHMGFAYGSPDQPSELHSRFTPVLFMLKA